MVAICHSHVSCHCHSHVRSACESVDTHYTWVKSMRHVRCIKAAPNQVADNFKYVGQSESFAEELHNMRLVIAFALFLGVLDLAYSAPHANSEALLQELRDALNEKEVQQQK